MQNLSAEILSPSTLKSIEAMREAAMKAAEPFSAMQKHIQEIMQTCSPVLEAVAKQNETREIVIKALDLPRMEPIYKEMARMAEQANQLREALTPSVNISFLPEREILYLPIPHKSQEEKEYIIEDRSLVSKTPFIVFNPEKGEFFFNGNQIDFPDEDANYVLLIKALFTLCDKDGFCPYRAIDKFFENAGKGRIIDKNKKIKRIHNAYINLNRRRKDQMCVFPHNTPDGKPVIRFKTGHGLVLNNPEI